MVNETVIWSQKMVDSVMERYPKLYELKQYHGKWSYDYGVVLKGIEKVWKQTGDQKYFDFIKSNICSDTAIFKYISSFNSVS